ncbi:xanthine dehydrogenase family protein molybdopterin-binding subunit [Terrarubrum flagellatum]|uniref:xanthine dehydrogenase family protein molybdopterin-binding subunit n=1 Tax=Terrirubrum flagellatum TaxID=2895980 RepID=UPI003144E800
MTIVPSRRQFLKASGALLMIGAAPAARGQIARAIDEATRGRPLATSEVDAFFAIHGDGSVTLFSGKVDLGTGLRIAYRQIVAEELGVGVDRIHLVEGDTALTPNQGPTSGSTGIAQGGMQIRRAAATARAALIDMAAQRLGVPVADLDTENGEIRARNGGASVGFGALIGDRRFALKVDAKASLRNPATYRVVGKPVPRPDLPAKLTGRHVYIHDFAVEGMLHGRVARPPSIGASLASVDESSIAQIPRARIVRIKDFLGVVAADEWDAVRALAALKAKWNDGPALIGDAALPEWMRSAEAAAGDETPLKRGDVATAFAGNQKRIEAAYYWPMQSHASMGPSCAVADMRNDGATIWCGSQGTHRWAQAFAKLLGLPDDKVRMIYLDGAGCYGTNGHEDAAMDAALLSRAVGRPVRVQWSREDEHGWDPKGPPQLLRLEASLSPEGKIEAWRTEMWVTKATANLPHIPLLGADAAGIPQQQGFSTGLVTGNGDPPYDMPNMELRVHWLKSAPLRTSNLRAPGKIGNVMAVEAFMDELAFTAGKDPLEFRIAAIKNPRGLEVLRKVGEMMRWEPRATPRRDGKGRGVAYTHYKNNETLLAMGMDVEVDAKSGVIRVLRVACAHDCGQIISPDNVRAQVEGCILQTISRALFEEVKFDAKAVTSTDWSSYPILTMPDAPKLDIALIDRSTEPPMGAGEAAASPVAAAIANAVFDATGARLRYVPFTPERVKQTLDSVPRAG